MVINISHLHKTKKSRGTRTFISPAEFLFNNFTTPFLETHSGKIYISFVEYENQSSDTLLKYYQYNQKFKIVTTHNSRKPKAFSSIKIKNNCRQCYEPKYLDYIKKIKVGNTSKPKYFVKALLHNKIILKREI